VHHPDVLAMTAEPTTTPTHALDAELETFLRSDYPRVVAAVALITRDRARAEDAVQDAVVNTLARPPRHAIRSLAAWITVVATNEARMGNRRRGAEARAMARAAEEPTPGGDVAAAITERASVTDALGELPQHQRQV